MTLNIDMVSEVVCDLILRHFLDEFLRFLFYFLFFLFFIYLFIFFFFCLFCFCIIFTIFPNYVEWAIITREISFVTSIFVFSDSTINPILKKVLSKRKEFAPVGSKFFRISVGPFSEGNQGNFDILAAPENVSIYLNKKT